MKRFPPFLSLLLSGSAPPSRTRHYKPNLYQTHLTGSSHCTAERVTMVKQQQQPFKASPKKHSHPSTAGRRLHHQRDPQMLGVKREEKVGSKGNHKPELSTGSFTQTRWRCLTAGVLSRRRVKMKRRWLKTEQQRRCRQVSEQMEEEIFRAAQCAWWSSLLGKSCKTNLTCFISADSWVTVIKCCTIYRNVNLDADSQFSLTQTVFALNVSLLNPFKTFWGSGKGNICRFS